jgi:hypothetical protein
MANMYGYDDYNGPLTTKDWKEPETAVDDDEDEDNPLQVGHWMEGDSLAPPCGTSVPTIHKLLDFASVSSDDVVYDLGCGDGRVCLEALVHFGASECVGVEVEQDLVERFEVLIGNLTESKERIHAVHVDLRQVLDFLVLLTARSGADKPNQPTNKQFENLPTPTVLVLYLLPESVRELEVDLLKLISGFGENFRLICNTWGLETIKPSKLLEVSEIGGMSSTIFRLYDKDSLEG